jgi:hypothetical protein
MIHHHKGIKAQLERFASCIISYQDSGGYQNLHKQQKSIKKPLHVALHQCCEAGHVAEGSYHLQLHTRAWLDQKKSKLNARWQIQSKWQTQSGLTITITHISIIRQDTFSMNCKLGEEFHWSQNTESKSLLQSHTHKHACCILGWGFHQ